METLLHVCHFFACCIRLFTAPDVLLFDTLYLFDLVLCCCVIIVSLFSMTNLYNLV